MPTTYYNPPYLELVDQGSVNYLRIASSHGAGQDLIDGVSYHIPLDDAAYSTYEVVGTALTWDESDPAVITINTDGVYDIYGIATVQKGTNNAMVQLGVYIDGSQLPKDALFSPFVPSQTIASVIVQTPFIHILARSLTAGQEVEFVVTQSNNAANDTKLLYGGYVIVKRS